MNNQGFCRSAAAVIVQLFLLCCAWNAALHPTRAASSTLFGWESTWRYADNGNQPATNWYATNFNDSAWSSGNGQFGYGDGDEQTLILFGSDGANKFITTYFRRQFQFQNSGAYTYFTIDLVRDDGAVVYLNGVELYRSNMPDGTVDYRTLAAQRLGAPAEEEPDSRAFPISMLKLGANTIAVEVHQASPSSDDLSFDMHLAASSGGFASVVRGPYLQVGTSSNIVVRWRTSVPTDTVAHYGVNAGNLNQAVTNLSFKTEHEIVLTNLLPATRYYYEVGTSTEILAGDTDYSFVTAPVPGTVQPVRIWAIGDSGTGFQAQYDVRDAYASYTGSRYTDVWLMLGDNAYCCGYDDQYQDYVFNVYPELLRRTVLWPAIGNHDTAFSSAELDTFPFYQIFTMPTMGQAGGVPSGSEHYYSFDYANIHFICLDSMATTLRQPGSAMLNWLEQDLAQTTRDWIIAYWHHPPYTKGTHNSDVEGDLIQMRQNVVPILEAYGVDLVLTGHSHNYERSYLIDGWYGPSTAGQPANFVSMGSGKTNDTGAYLKPAGGLGARRGAIYITDGSSGGQGTGGSINHPAMYYSTYDFGSVVIDVHGQRLDASFIRDDGTITDYFSIDKRNVTNAIPRLSIARAGTNAVVSWPTSLPDYRLESKGVLTSSVPWMPSPIVPGTNGRRKVVNVGNKGTNEFFRLRQTP